MKVIFKEFIKISNSFKSIIFWSVFSAFMVLAFICILLVDKELHIELAREGANTERLTAVFYFLGGILLFIRSYNQFRLNRNFKEVIFLILFAIFFIFIAFEEESWGQWIFHFDAPQSIKDLNYQKEINIHNLSFFIKYKFLFDAHRILNVYVLIVGIILPLLYKYSLGARRLLNRLHFPVCPLSALTIFVLAIIYEKTAMQIFSHWANIEIREFLFSFGFLLFSVSVYGNNNYISNT